MASTTTTVLLLSLLKRNLRTPSVTCDRYVRLRWVKTKLQRRRSLQLFLRKYPRNLGNLRVGALRARTAAGEIEVLRSVLVCLFFDFFRGLKQGAHHGPTEEIMLTVPSGLHKVFEAF